MGKVFGEITSRTNNARDSPHAKTKAKAVNKEKMHNRYSIPDEVYTRVEVNESEDDNLTGMQSSESEESGYSYASKSESSYTNSNDGYEDDLSTDYETSDYDSTDGSALSYCSSSDSADDQTASSEFVKEVKKRTRRVEEEYKNNVERKLRAVHLVACRHLRNDNLTVAQQKFEEILATLCEEFGETHKRVGSALHNLGIVHLRAGNYTDAVDAIQAAIRIRIAKLGDYHPKVADSLVELGIALIHQNDFDKAVEFFNEALAIRESELKDTKHSDIKEKKRIQLQIAKIHNNIGCSHFEVGEINEAREAFECTYKIQSQINNVKGTPAPAKLAMSSTICNLGFVHLENADWKMAIEKLEEALKIQKNIVDSSSKIVHTTMEHLGYAYVKYGHFDQSLKIYNEIVEMKKSFHDKGDCSYLDVGDLEVADSMKKLVYCQMKLYKYEEALETLQEIESILEINYHEDDKKLRKLRELIGSVHYEMHKHPSFAELIARNMTLFGFRNPFNTDLLCRCAAEFESGEFLPCKPTQPPVKTKMSGHNISFA